MKIAFVTDSHFDHVNRFAECIRIHDWIAEDARARGCELTLLGGDVFERKSTGEERNAVERWLTKMADFGPVVMVYGNHDIAQELEIFSRLETRHPIRVVSRPEVVEVYGLGIACMPWPRRAHILAEAGVTDRDAAADVAIEAMRSILQGLGYRGPAIFLGHTQVRGCKTSTAQVLVGCDFELGLEDLALVNARFYALGHIHREQGWSIDWLVHHPTEKRIESSPVAYGGSPRRCDFGEDETKFYTVIEFDGSNLVGWERIETPATPMVLLEAQWSSDGLTLNMHELDELPPGAEIRLRYDVPREHQDAARESAKGWVEQLKSNGAAFVKPEPHLITQTVARAPEIGSATTLEEKLGALWRHRDTFPGVERAERLFGKLRQLQEETRA